MTNRKLCIDAKKFFKDLCVGQDFFFQIALNFVTIVISLHYLTNYDHQLFELNKKYDLFHHVRYLSQS